MSHEQDMHSPPMGKQYVKHYSNCMLVCSLHAHTLYTHKPPVQMSIISGKFLVKGNTSILQQIPCLLGLLKSNSSLTRLSPSKLLILYVLIVSHDSSCQRLFKLHIHFVATYVSHDSRLQASTHPLCLRIFGPIQTTNFLWHPVLSCWTLD